MNISATKQNSFIKLEQNLGQPYLFNSAKQGNVSSEENQKNLSFFDKFMLWIIHLSK